MPETSVIDGALMTVKTARTWHHCDGPYPEGHSIEPGEQYEYWRVPPWRGGNESPYWWQGMCHLGAADSRVCAEIEAYREKAVREQQAFTVDLCEFCLKPADHVHPSCGHCYGTGKCPITFCITCAGPVADLERTTAVTA